jgi:hypothetical protein
MPTRKSLRHYHRGDRHHVQAQRIWLILVAVVMRRTDPEAIPTITYGELASHMRYDPRAGRTLSRPLGMVGWFCLDHGLPALNSIVVNATTMKPGHDVVTKPGRNWREEQRLVADLDWWSLRVPAASAFREAWQTPQETYRDFYVRLPATTSDSRDEDWVKMQVGVAAAVAGMSGAKLTTEDSSVKQGVLSIHFRIDPGVPVDEKALDTIMAHLRVCFEDREGYLAEWIG